MDTAQQRVAWWPGRQHPGIYHHCAAPTGVDAGISRAKCDLDVCVAFRLPDSRMLCYKCLVQSASSQGEWFSSTHWSVVAQAAESNLPGSREALESLCRNYWPPLFLFALRSGHSREDARDLTQGFFERLIARSYLATADPERGKFRSFLLATFKHFIAHEREKSQAAKRGGGIDWISVQSEEYLAAEPADHRSPDLLFDQTWAISLFEQVLARLRSEFRMSGQEALFENFKQYLTGDSSEPYTAVAARIGMTEGAAKMFVSRLRGRYRQLLRNEIARTVSNASEVEEEIRHLRTIFFTR